ncbi:DUF1003 domain-containing protein [Flavisolibacter tropicus]|uniref:Cyclic nucleotide-binding protein n=1 Tax=Flavisolibacter tropicus TaxID=1492898 RepID=A0A172TV80_9BACT|nr:DUF1003 domain-containing protein [Flavisolibacter tropicus]ANE50693.1 cyclic nucleotide-binding protein [Flavisolibacter tropicus]
MKKEEIDHLFKAEKEQLHKLHDIIKQSMQDEESIVENLLHPPQEILTPGQTISDKVARFGGSWTFIITFLLILVAWIVYNSLLPNNERFDPYPFILMNLVLSCIAALQAPIIMMSQNRQEEKDRQRAQNDYMVNMKAELEIRSLHQKIDLLLQEQMKTLYEIQQKQMDLLNQIQSKLASHEQQ